MKRCAIACSYPDEAKVFIYLYLTYNFFTRQEDELRLKKKNIKSDAIRATIIFRYGEKRTVAETTRLAKQQQAIALDKLGEVIIQ